MVNGHDVGPEGDVGGGLSPNARLIFVSPDQIGRWRLDKSLALDNARWALSIGRRDIAATHVVGARFCHLQIMRIKAHLRRRSGERFAFDLESMAARIAADAQISAQLETHDESEKAAAATGATRDANSAAPGEGRKRDADGDGAAPERQVGVHISLADAEQTRPRKRRYGHRDPAGGDFEGPREYLRLAPREREYVQLLAGGQCRADIAAHMELPVKTVGVYHSITAKKLGIKSKALAGYCRDLAQRQVTS